MSTANKKSKQTKNMVKIPNQKKTIEIKKVLSESENSETDSESDLEPESKPNNSKLKLQSKESESEKSDSDTNTKPNNSKIKPNSQSKKSESDESECDDFKSDESECDDFKSDPNLEFELKSKPNNDKLKSQEKESEIDESESEDTNSEESDDEVIKITKKKIKKNWEETSNELKKIYVKLKTDGIDIKKHIDGLAHCLKVNNENMRQLKKILNEINTAHVNDIKENEAKKKIRKKKNPNSAVSGGIGKQYPIPPILTKYLELDEEQELSRIEISTLLHKKFHTDNLKNGQITTLDKNAAELLGKKENREIKFGEVQTFIKEFYDEHDFHKKFKDNNLNNKTAIPSKLVKYLNLNKGTQLSHFEISRLLLDKLYSKEQKDYNKKEKIKPKFFVFDKDMSNSLGIDINRKIEIAEFTTFFIEFYK